MGIFDSIGDFFTDNKSWLKPVTNFISGIGGSAVNSRNQEAYLQALRDAEQRNYDDAKAYNDAYVDYLGRKSAASAASSASSAAASRANQAAAMKAGKKALKQEKKGFKQLKDLWQPFVDTGKQVLPQMTQAYGMGFGNLQDMNKLFQTPEFQASTKQSVPAYEINVPIPNYLLGRKA